MSVTVDSSSAIKALKKLGSNYKKAEKKAVSDASLFVQSKLESNTPVYKDSRNGKHAKDEVVKSTTKDGYAEIGYSNEVSWRMHFIEFGTINQRPQGFVQRTQREIEKEVVKIMTNAIKKELIK